MNEKRACRQRTAQQINGREGETATLLSRFLVNSNGLGGGFAPRHLNRSVARGFVAGVKQGIALDTILC